MTTARLLVDGRFFARENARACQDLLRRAITRRGVPDVLYADNGAPFANAWLARTCAVLGTRLVHSKPYSPQGRGKQERLNRYMREAFLAEACHHGIESLEQLNDLFAVGRAGREPAGACRDRAGADRPVDRRPAPAGPDAVLADAFRWSVTRRVTRVATVPLEGNSYCVDPALPAGASSCGSTRRTWPGSTCSWTEASQPGTLPFIIGRHMHKAVAPPQVPPGERTGIDYLGLVAAAHEDEARRRREARLHRARRPRRRQARPEADEPGQERMREAR